MCTTVRQFVLQYSTRNLSAEDENGEHSCDVMLGQRTHRGCKTKAAGHKIASSEQVVICSFKSDFDVFVFQGAVKG
jgi:hypothetical protein